MGLLSFVKLRIDVGSLCLGLGRSALNRFPRLHTYIFRIISFPERHRNETVTVYKDCKYMSIFGRKRHGDNIGRNPERG